MKMGKVTDIVIQKKDKNRVSIFIDNEFAFGLSIETLMKNKIKKGDEISEELKEKLLLCDEYNVALNKAMDYISKTIKTKKQIYQYLIGKGYEKQTVYAVIDKLKEYHYIDDVEYAKKYLEFSLNKQGEKLSSVKLMAKGIKKEDIEKAINEENIDYTSSINNIFEKYMRNKEFTKENIAKACRYLYGKGFSYDDIENVVAKYKD